LPLWQMPAAKADRKKNRGRRVRRALFGSDPSPVYRC
jgi:hypothetical protein